MFEKYSSRRYYRGPNGYSEDDVNVGRVFIPFFILMFLLREKLTREAVILIAIACGVPCVLYVIWRNKPRSQAAYNSLWRRLLDPVFLFFPSYAAKQVYLGSHRNSVLISYYDEDQDDDTDDVLWYQFLGSPEHIDKYWHLRMDADRCSLSQLRSLGPGSDVILELGGCTYKFFILESISYYPPEEIPPIDMAYQGEPRLTIITHPSASEGATGLCAVAVCKPKSLSA